MIKLHGTRVLIAVVVVSLLCASALWAQPTLRGYTGMLIVPNAETVGDGNYYLGWGAGEGGDLENHSFYGTFGLDENTEVGVNMWRPKGAENQTFLHAKYTLPVEAGPQIATGVFDLTGELDTTVYAVATWRQGQIIGEVDDRPIQFLNLHAGFAAGMFSDIFAGVEMMFGPEVGIMAEWVDNDVHVGARFQPVDMFHFDVGLLDIDELVFNLSYGTAF